MDKRIEKTLDKVRSAAIEVLAEQGFSAFSMDAVAVRSGVARSTLYRHWSDRIALISDALEAQNRQPPQGEILRKGELRNRTISLISHLAAVFESSPIARAIPALIEAAEHYPQVAAFLHAYSAARRQALVDLLRAGIEVGDIAPETDPELTAVILSGPIFYCRLMSPEPFPVGQVPDLVDFALGRTPSAQQMP